MASSTSSCVTLPRKVLSKTVFPHGEVTETEITIRLPGSILLDVDSAALRADAERVVEELAQVLIAEGGRAMAETRKSWVQWVVRGCSGLILLAILASLGCGRGKEQPTGVDSGPARKVVTGPIVGLVTAASLDDRGRLVEQASSFEPSTPQMTVVVQVGKVASTVPLTIAWYSTSKQGDEKLFEHTIQVAAFDRAYSVGRSPGRLASGKYKAVATLGGASQTITWMVAEKQAAPVQQARPPVSGVSGTVSVVQGAAAAAPPDCEAFVRFMPHSGPTVYSVAMAYDPKRSLRNPAQCASLGNLPGDLEVAVMFTGMKKPFVTCTFSAAEIECEDDRNPCDMPAGSDLPGAALSATLTQKSTGRVLDETSDALSNDVVGPTLQLVSDPSGGVTMKRGKTIKLTGIAEEIDQVGWHKGVKEIRIVKTPVRQVIHREQFPLRTACDKKALKRKTNEFPYVIPGNAPAAMRFCSEADDWAGNPGEPDCVKILISPKLAGTIDSTTETRAGNATVTSQMKGDLSLTVTADGSLTGTVRLTFTFLAIHPPFADSCGATESIEPQEVILPITGSLTENGIVFQWASTTIAPLITIKPNCGPVQKGLGAFDAAVYPFRDWLVDWDGTAYTVDDEFKDSGPGWTRSHKWNLRLEPVDDAGVS